MKKLLKWVSLHNYALVTSHRVDSLVTMLEYVILRALFALRLYPHFVFAFTHFKMFEYEELVKDVNFTPQDFVLDIGCGSGIQTLLLGMNCGKVFGIDVSPKAIATAQRIASPVSSSIKSEFRVTKTENAGFPDCQFDKIFSFSVIEHIPNHDEVFGECFRILQEGGQLIFSADSLSTIHNEELLKKHKRDHAVCTYFEKRELRLTLQRIGFREVRIYSIFRSDYSRRLFEKGIRKSFQYGLVASVFLYLKLKRSERMMESDGDGIFIVVKAIK